jgi:hypothetical protein
MRERLLVRDSTCKNFSNTFERGTFLQERPNILMHLRDYP